MSNIFIHPSSVIETENIGEGTYIGPFCYVGSRVKIGKNCKLFAHCSIGAPPQYKTPPEDKNGIIHIDDGTEIREFVTVNLPTQAITYIGKNSYLMANSHIPHDAYLSDDSFIVVGAALAGFSHIGKHCYLGLNCTTHQHSKLGDYCLLGANSFFRGESPPGIIWGGVPAKPLKINKISIERNAPKEQIEKIITEAELFIDHWKLKEKNCAD